MPCRIDSNTEAKPKESKLIIQEGSSKRKAGSLTEALDHHE
jgi:hypothetical protein